MIRTTSYYAITMCCALYICDLSYSLQPTIDNTQEEKCPLSLDAQILTKDYVVAIRSFL